MCDSRQPQDGAGSAVEEEPRVKSKLPLVGIDGNAFGVIGTVSRGLRAAGATHDEVKAFQAEAMAGDYDHLLTVAMKWSADEDE